MTTVALGLECPVMTAGRTRLVHEEASEMRAVVTSEERLARRVEMNERRVRRIASRWGVGEVEIVSGRETAS